MTDHLVDPMQHDVAALVLHEQERLGRQLHDSLGPHLTGISMLATSLHERLQCNSAAETALAGKLLDHIERAKADLRALTKGLIPVEIDSAGLVSALTELVDKTSLTYELRCRLECDREVAVHDNFIATRFFRIAKEAVHNAIKHAQCTELVVRLCDQGGLILEVQDDGQGFTQPLQAVEGNGIRIMRFRAQLIGGRLEIRSGPGGGTIVRCSIVGKDNSDA